MPNHYQNIAICRFDYEAGKVDEFDADAFTKQHKDVNFCRLLRPQPEGLNDQLNPHVLTDAARAWQVANWGCKWGTYDVQCFDLKGDGSPFIVAFLSPWCAPKPMLPEIARHLYQAHGLLVLRWIGFDPSDYTTELL